LKSYSAAEREIVFKFVTGALELQSRITAKFLARHIKKTEGEIHQGRRVIKLDHQA